MWTTDVTVAGLSARRGERSVLHGVTATFAAGAVTCVTGPNGSGKSTLLEVVAGVHPATGGRVTGTGRTSVAFVPQRSAVPEHLPITVAETVAMGRWRERGWWRPLGGVDRRTVDERLELLGLTALRGRPLEELSGGQRQRAFVAQGLAQRAPVLVLDEPTAGIDETSQRIVVEALRIEAAAGAVVVHATHEPAAVAAADAELRLLDGRVT